MIGRGILRSRTGEDHLSLQTLILGPTCVGWDRPLDHLVRIKNVTGFTVNAVGVIDLQAFTSLPIIDHFVDIRRTEVLAWIAILLFALGHTKIRFRNFQMAWLMFRVD